MVLCQTEVFNDIFISETYFVYNRTFQMFWFFSQSCLLQSLKTRGTAISIAEEENLPLDLTKEKPLCDVSICLLDFVWNCSKYIT